MLLNDPLSSYTLISPEESNTVEELHHAHTVFVDFVQGHLPDLFNKLDRQLPATP